MKLNLGCGGDIRPGYVNVDFRQLPGVDVVCDLSQLPWPWVDGSAEEVLMHDFLEHFPHRLTQPILAEAWRILGPGGTIDVQVPDFAHCSNAIRFVLPYACNRCGRKATPAMVSKWDPCPCGQTPEEIAWEAVRRLYGGQDYEGNYHYAAFTLDLLSRLLEREGFGDVEELRTNQNGETYWQNWNIRLRAVRMEDPWK